MKYIISVLLAAALLLSAIPAAAVTATPDETAAANPDTLYGDTDGRLHIGFVESVETDSSGKVTKVHTIEGNFNWDNAYPTSTKVSRSVWTIGKRRYGALLCEYIDIEKLFS